jgi:hypothetical protein
MSSDPWKKSKITLARVMMKQPIRMSWRRNNMANRGESQNELFQA